VRYLLVLALVVLLFAAMAYWYEKQRGERGKPSVDSDLLYAASEVVEAFSEKDGEKLAKWVHPAKGVRFSPYAFVDVENNLVFSKSEITLFWTDTKAYQWGYDDGTGEPIYLNPGQYCDRYIMDRDFRDASAININNDQVRGNISNNAASVYPTGARVEYYIGPKPGEGMPEFEWSALRLVFEKIGNDWLLVAVIHDEWTT